MPEQNFTQGSELVQGIHCPGRVAWAVDNEHSGSGSDGLFQLRRGNLEILFDTRFDYYRLAFRDKNDIRIGNPVGGRYDDFIAGIDDRQRQIEKTLLAAARYEDLRRSVIESVVALELVNNGVLETWSPAYRRIFCKTLVDRDDGRVLDMLRGIKIRLAGAKPDNIPAFCLEPRSSGRYSQGGGGLDSLNALREFHDNVLIVLMPVRAAPA